MNVEVNKRNRWRKFYEPKFLYYYCYKLDEYCKECLRQGNFASVDMKKFSKFQFPILPREIQREIVRILDNFTELTARKVQYKEVLITIRKAIDANDVNDVVTEWNAYVSEQREKELTQIIQEEKLKEPETRKYLANAFRDGEIKTVGTDIDKLMPPVSRFGGGGRTQKKQTVIDKLKEFFDKYFGVGGSSMSEENS